MGLEVVFKIILTVIATICYVWFLIWIWTHQIDTKSTFSSFFKKNLTKQTEWIETRDQNCIYQNGETVGKISGKVEDSQNKIVFYELYDTAKLNTNLPFEYGRLKVKISNINSSIGILSDGRTVKNSVLQGVVCEKLR